MVSHSFSGKKKLGAYWVNTSSNSLAGKLICEGDLETKLIMEDLMVGKSFHTQMDEEIIFKQLNRKKSAVWSLFVASGYLKIVKTIQNRRGKQEYVLALTNREVLMMFDDMAMDWFSSRRREYHEFSDALLSGNKVFMNEYLNEIAQETFSSFDTGAKPSEYKQPENFYHGFVLGLIADLRSLYQITSNRESGYGRYDVVLDPLEQTDGDGIILEFKVQDTKCEKSLQDTVKTALRQIIEKKYASALLAKGMRRERIRIYGIAFHGKQILVDGGALSE